MGKMVFWDQRSVTDYKFALAKEIKSIVLVVILFGLSKCGVLVNFPVIYSADVVNTS